MKIMMVVMMMTMMSSCMTKREGDVSERSGSSSNWQICTNHFFLQSAARGRKGQGCSAFQSFHILPPSNSDEEFLPYNLEVGGVRFAFWNGNVFN